MNIRIVLSVLALAALLMSAPASAQTPQRQYTDPVNGLSLEQAIARALEQEPSLQAARATIDIARGIRLQASLRPNPSVSFERREEPSGTDNQTMVAVEWPLDLFRRAGRVAVAEREIAATQFAVADRERLLAAEVRMRYGAALAAIRDLTTLDELVTTTQEQHGLLQSRVEEGASPRLERDLLDVEVRRLESERLLQLGQTEAALIELKRMLGMAPDANMLLRDTLESLVQSESASSLDRLPATASSQRADVREAEARVTVAEAKTDRARQNGRIDATVFGSYMHMDTGFPQRAFAPNGNLERIHGKFHYVSAGVSVTLPLFNRNRGEVAAAQAERAGAIAAHQATRLTAETELAAARTRDSYAHSAAMLYSSGVQTLARQNVAVVSQSYGLGRLSVFDVLAEQRRFLDVERAYTTALRSAYEARTALIRAIGDSQ